MGEWTAIECRTHPHLTVYSSSLAIVEHRQRPAIRFEREDEEDWSATLYDF
jgi:hypothetical protein